MTVSVLCLWKPRGIYYILLTLQLALLTLLFAGVNGNKCSGSSPILEKYKVGKVIGDGNFAVVKECIER